jgi:hypothetical protein
VFDADPHDALSLAKLCQAAAKIAKHLTVVLSKHLFAVHAADWSGLRGTGWHSCALTRDALAEGSLMIIS